MGSILYAGAAGVLRFVTHDVNSPLGATQVAIQYLGVQLSRAVANLAPAVGVDLHEALTDGHEGIRRVTEELRNAREATQPTPVTAGGGLFPLRCVLAAAMRLWGLVPAGVTQEDVLVTWNEVPCWGAMLTAMLAMGPDTSRARVKISCDANAVLVTVAHSNAEIPSSLHLQRALTELAEAQDGGVQRTNPDLHCTQWTVRIPHP